MSIGKLEDIRNTIYEMNNPSDKGTAPNWLRHDGGNVLVDEKLLTGITEEEMARLLVAKKFKPSNKKAIEWMRRHFRHLTSTGKTESERGHNLIIIKDTEGKMRFDFNRMESTLNSNTNNCLYTFAPCYPEKEDVDAAELQVRAMCSDKIISIDDVLNQIEINYKKTGKSFKEDWREVTKRNIRIWFGNNQSTGE